jgi:hypothetical protein
MKVPAPYFRTPSADPALSNQEMLRLMKMAKELLIKGVLRVSRRSDVGETQDTQNVDLAILEAYDQHYSALSNPDGWEDRPRWDAQDLEGDQHSDWSEFRSFAHEFDWKSGAQDEQELPSVGPDGSTDES